MLLDFQCEEERMPYSLFSAGFKLVLATHAKPMITLTDDVISSPRHSIADNVTQSSYPCRLSLSGTLKALKTEEILCSDGLKIKYAYEVQRDAGIYNLFSWIAVDPPLDVDTDYLFNDLFVKRWGYPATQVGYDVTIIPKTSICIRGD